MVASAKEEQKYPLEQNKYPLSPASLYVMEELKLTSRPCKMVKLDYLEKKHKERLEAKLAEMESRRLNHQPA